MKILKIVETDYGEVAYLFDGARVIKTYVEDMTQRKEPTSRMVREIEPIEEEYDIPPVPRRMVRRPVEEELEPEKDPYPPKRPVGRPRSIVPANLAGVFRKPDMPGAAVETRQV